MGIGAIDIGAGGGGWLLYDGSNDGSDVVIENTTLGGINGSARLDNTRAAILYNRTGPSGDLVLAVCKTDGTSATIDVDTAGNNKTAQRVTRISDSKVMVVYYDFTTTDLNIKTYSISGVTPTLDAATSFAPNTPVFSDTAIAVVGLHSTRALLCYPDSTPDIQLVGIQVGSGSITIDGSETTLVLGNEAISMDRLSDSAAIIVYDDGGPIKAVVATDGTPPTLGTPANIVGAGSVPRHVTANSAGDGFMTDVDARVLSYCTISGTTITPNSALAADTTPSDDLLGSVQSITFLQNDGAQDIFAFTISEDNNLSSNINQIGIAAFSDVDTMGLSFLSQPPTTGNESDSKIQQLSSSQAMLFHEDANDDPVFRVINK